MIKKSNLNEVASFYHGYISLVGETDLVQQLKERLTIVKSIWGNIPEEKQNYAYAEGKWTIKQLLGHMIDTERIFAYRALCISRGEAKPLPGFDENDYVQNANFQFRAYSGLVEEFEVVRKSSIILIENMDVRTLENQGISNGNPATPRAFASLIIGHEIHHTNILNERYL